jgi:hypothetical protein
MEFWNRLSGKPSREEDEAMQSIVAIIIQTCGELLCFLNDQQIKDTSARLLTWLAENKDRAHQILHTEIFETEMLNKKPISASCYALKFLQQIAACEVLGKGALEIYPRYTPLRDRASTASKFICAVLFRMFPEGLPPDIRYLWPIFGDAYDNWRTFCLRSYDDQSRSFYKDDSEYLLQNSIGYAEVFRKQMDTQEVEKCVREISENWEL